MLGCGATAVSRPSTRSTSSRVTSCCSRPATSCLPTAGSWSSATLEVQEAALTGESAPIAKDATTLPEGDVALGDRTNLVFQNTQVTRGSATFVVTDTGQSTQMGRIADMVTATKRARRRSSVELDGLTKIFGLLAWTAVAIIAIVGIARGQDTETLILLVHLDGDLGDPDRAADVRADDAVLGSAASRRVQGGGEVAHRRRDARRHHGHQQRQDRHADDERDDGDHDARRRSVVPDRGRRLHEVRRHPRRRRANRCRTSSRLALGLVLCSDATVGDDESIIGDPTEAALVVLAAKIGVDAEETRRADAAARGGAVRLRVQVHGDVPRPAGAMDRGRSCTNPTS